MPASATMTVFDGPERAFEAAVRLNLVATVTWLPRAETVGGARRGSSARSTTTRHGRVPPLRPWSKDRPPSRPCGTPVSRMEAGAPVSARELNAANEVGRTSGRDCECRPPIAAAKMQRVECSDRVTDGEAEHAERAFWRGAVTMRISNLG